MAGFLDWKMGRRHPHCHDRPPQGRLDSAKRRSPKRQSDCDHTNSAARQLSDGCYFSVRPGVSDRTFCPQYGFRACPTTGNCAVPLRSCRRDRSAAGCCAPPLAGDKHVSERVSGCVRHTSGSNAGWRGDDVSGIQIKIEKYENAAAPGGKTWGQMTAFRVKARRICMALMLFRAMSSWLPYAAAPRVSAQTGAWSDSW